MIHADADFKLLISLPKPVGITLFVLILNEVIKQKWS